MSARGAGEPSSAPDRSPTAPRPIIHSEPTIDTQLEAALTHIRDRRLEAAAELLSTVGARLETESVPPSDPRRGDHGALVGHVMRLRGDPDGARALLERVLSEAMTHGWWAVGSRAAVQLGWLVRSAGDTALAERWMREAVRLADRAGSDEIVSAYCPLAELLALHGDRSGAERALEVASEQARTDAQRFRVEITRANLADRYGRPDEAERALRIAARCAPGEAAAYEVSIQRAKVALGRGDDAHALRHARRAARLASGWGSDIVKASARMLLGEVARSLGRLDEADRAYRSAETLYGGLISARIARLNRAMVHLERGEHETAASLAAPMHHTFPGNPLAEAAALLCTIPDTAHRGEQGAVSEALSEITGRLSASGSVHRDIACLASTTADLLAPLGQFEPAVRLVALAHEQWRRMGNAEQLARASARLRELRAAGAPVPLRGFLLDAIIGEGASGAVWRGRHAASGELVAIKVLRGGPAVTATVRSMFARELRAVAGLDHPNVVWLLDHGWVDDAAAVVEPRLEVDAPFLALEFASLGTLDARCGRMSWSESRPVLLSVLDGLAHAHARGLLHLDLKPTNVLLSGSPAKPIPKLADFGLARAPAPGRQLRATGTPAYMAPEQFGNDAGALGPWTDLYALGCVITAILTGAPPFGLSGAAQLRDAHLHRAPPPLVPSTPVPDGLLSIVERLLAKPPSQRFGSAAEVARAIAALGPLAVPDIPGLRTSLPPPPPPPPPSERSGPTTVLLPVVEAAVAAAEDSDDGSPAPFPDRWDERVTRPRGSGLIAAGLGLVSLRRPRTVGRRGERAALWEALRTVVAQRTGAARIITGEAGSGARHLARWLAERGHELGAARGLMLGRGPLPGGLNTPDPAQAARELERLAAGRPLVVGLLRAEEMPSAETLLRAATLAQRPVLCIATVRSPIPEALAALAPALALGPVPLDQLTEIVSTLLPLDPAVSGALCERSAGSPGRAIQMVRRLAEDRQLVPVEGRWTLRPSAELDALLRPVRIRQQLDALPLPERTALHVLSDAGSAATPEAWIEAARAGGVETPELVIERLARSGWVDADGATLRLADGVADVLGTTPPSRSRVA